MVFTVKQAGDNLEEPPNWLPQNQNISLLYLFTLICIKRFIHIIPSICRTRTFALLFAT